LLTLATTDNLDAGVTSFLWTVQTAKDLGFSHNFWMCLFEENTSHAAACTNFFNITSIDAGIQAPITTSSGLTTQTRVILSAMKTRNFNKLTKATEIPNKHTDIRAYYNNRTCHSAKTDSYLDRYLDFYLRAHSHAYLYYIIYLYFYHNIYKHTDVYNSIIGSRTIRAEHYGKSWSWDWSSRRSPFPRWSRLFG
jgi:hypothetical protein